MSLLYDSGAGQISHDIIKPDVTIKLLGYLVNNVLPPGIAKARPPGAVVPHVCILEKESYHQDGILPK